MNDSVKILNHWDSFLPGISASILKSNYVQLLARSICIMTKKDVLIVGRDVHVHDERCVSLHICNSGLKLLYQLSKSRYIYNYTSVAPINRELL